jgi:hypothetical protein
VGVGALFLKHPKSDALKTMLGTDACTALHYVNYLGAWRVCLNSLHYYNAASL